MERKQKLMYGTSDEIPRKVFWGLLVLEDKISEVETELREARSEMRRLTVERRKRKLRGSGHLTRPESVCTGRRCQEPKSSVGEAGLAGATERRCSEEFVVGLNQGGSDGTKVL